MKKVEATFNAWKLDEIKEALAKERIQRVSLSRLKAPAPIKRASNSTVVPLMRKSRAKSALP